MRREVEVRAEHALHEVLATVMRLNPFLLSVDVTLEFNELRLNAAVEYNGAGLVVSDTLPSPEQMATEEGISAMSGFMIRSYADRVRVKSKENSWCRIQLSFDH